jgi:hypothetical protein
MRYPSSSTLHDSNQRMQRMLVTQKSGQFEVGVDIYVNSCKYQNMGIYHTKEKLTHNALHCSKICQHTEHRAPKLLHVQNTQTQIHMHLSVFCTKKPTITMTVNTMSFVVQTQCNKIKFFFGSFKSGQDHSN